LTANPKTVHCNHGYKPLRPPAEASSLSNTRITRLRAVCCMGTGISMGLFRRGTICWLVSRPEQPPRLGLHTSARPSKVLNTGLITIGLSRIQIRARSSDLISTRNQSKSAPPTLGLISVTALPAYSDRPSSQPMTRSGQYGFGFQPNRPITGASIRVRRM
jgi:hypothetical protein